MTEDETKILRRAAGVVHALIAQDSEANIWAKWVPEYLHDLCVRYGPNEEET